MSRDYKTLWALKIKGSRTKHQLWLLAKLLFFFFAVLAALAAVQIVVCRQETPERPMLECLRRK